MFLGKPNFKILFVALFNWNAYLSIYFYLLFIEILVHDIVFYMRFNLLSKFDSSILHSLIHRLISLILYRNYWIIVWSTIQVAINDYKRSFANVLQILYLFNQLFSLSQSNIIELLFGFEMSDSINESNMRLFVLKYSQDIVLTQPSQSIVRFISAFVNVFCF